MYRPYRTISFETVYLRGNFLLSLRLFYFVENFYITSYLLQLGCLRWVFANHDHVCYVCNEGWDDQNHVFFECPFGGRMWTMLSNKLGSELSHFGEWKEVLSSRRGVAYLIILV